MQDLPENHFRVSGASWVNIITITITVNTVDCTQICELKRYLINLSIESWCYWLWAQNYVGRILANQELVNMFK